MDDLVERGDVCEGLMGEVMGLKIAFVAAGTTTVSWCTSSPEHRMRRGPDCLSGFCPKTYIGMDHFSGGGSVVSLEVKEHCLEPRSFARTFLTLFAPVGVAYS
jgi:hypothetical protein